MKITLILAHQSWVTMAKAIQDLGNEVQVIGDETLKNDLDLDIERIKYFSLLKNISPALKFPLLPYDKIKEFNPDIIHIMGEPSYGSTYQGVKIAEKLKKIGINVKVSCRAAQNIVQSFPLPFSLIEKRNLKRLDGIFHVSNDAKDVLITKGYSGKMSYLPNYYLEDQFFLETNTKKPGNSTQFLYVGHFTERKGIIEVTKALDLIKEKDWKLKFVGKGVLKKYLEKWASKYNGRVEIIEWIAPENLRKLYNSSDALIVYSKYSDGEDKRKWFIPYSVKWKEQFGRVIVEAMACGLPTIGSNSGEIPNLITNTGYVVGENNPAELAKKIENIIDKKIKKLPKEEISKESIRYSGEVVSKQLVQYFNEICSEN